MNKINEYTVVAKILHWAMAILIILELSIAYLFLASETFLLSPIAKYLYFLHFNIGFTLLILFVIRVLWKLSHKTPPYSAAIDTKEINLAKWGHMIIYILIGIMVVTGILRYNIHSGAFHYLNLITIPAIIATHNQLIYSIIAITHNLCGALLMATSAAHIALAINHHIINKNDILLRMLPTILHKRFYK